MQVSFENLRKLESYLPQHGNNEEQARESKIKPGAFKDADKKMTAVLICKLTKKQVREMYLTGKRYNGREALENGIVDRTGENEQDTMVQAIGLASEFAKKGIERNRPTIQTLKTELAGDEISCLLGEVIYAKL